MEQIFAVSVPGIWGKPKHVMYKILC